MVLLNQLEMLMCICMLKEQEARAILEGRGEDSVLLNQFGIRKISFQLRLTIPV